MLRPETSLAVVYNLADAAIVAGAVGIALFGVFDGKRKPSAAGKAGK